MNCRNIREQLILFAGEDLDALEAARVDAHTRQCLACYRELVDMRDAVARVRSLQEDVPSLEQLAPDDQFCTDVMSRIDGLPVPVRRLPRMVRSAGWAAAVLIGVFLGAHSEGLLGGGNTPAEQNPAARGESTPLFAGTQPVSTTPSTEAQPSSGGLRLVGESLTPMPDTQALLEALQRLQGDGTLRPGSVPASFPRRSTYRDF